MAEAPVSTGAAAAEVAAVAEGVASADAHVRIEALRKRYGSLAAVDGLSLEVPRGSFTTLLGPSGCGKTTVLRILAGFVEADGGRVLIDGRDQQELPPERRGVGMVFQDYALFPHMSVRANVEYGLRMRRAPADLRRQRADRALELLDLQELARRFPHELSGGQQQRVALGRVIALEPQVLLMDEPLSNLDAKLRLRLRADLKALQRELGITTIYVTHDQEEALSLSDQVAVLDRGRLQQLGRPGDVYQRPANRFVADFVGHANLLPVRAEGVHQASVAATALGRPLRLRLPDRRRPAAGDHGLAMVRPERIVLAAGAEAADAGWQASATVRSGGSFGAFLRYELQLDGLEQAWWVDVPDRDGSDPLPPGTRLALRLPDGAACWLW